MSSTHRFRWYGGAVCLIFILLFATLPLWAGVSAIAIGTGNDWITMGLGNNQDDGHSFSFITDLTFDSAARLCLFVEGVTDQQSAPKERFDSTTLVASYPIRLTAPKRTTFSLTPQLGVTMVGDLGLEWVQNLFHTALGRVLVSLPSAFATTAVYPYFGATLSARHPWTLVDLGMTLSGTHIPTWESEATVTAELTLSSFFTIAGGYSYQWNHSASTAQARKAAQYRGPLFSFSYDAHLVRTSWTALLSSDFAYGYFTFNPLALREPQRFVSGDLTFSAGITYDLYGLQTRIAAIRYKTISCTVHYSNGQMGSDNLYRRNIGSWSIGKIFRLGSAEAWAHPSVQIYGGIKRLNLVKHYTETQLETARPLYGVQIGLAIGKDPGWIIANTAYQFRLILDLSHTLFSESARTGVPAWDSTQAKPLSLLLGFVLEVSHDLSH